jgi:hypothetical protein
MRIRIHIYISIQIQIQIHIDLSLPQRNVMQFEITRMTQFLPARNLFLACSSNILSIIEWNPALVHEQIPLPLSPTISDATFATDNFIVAAADRQNPFLF